MKDKRVSSLFNRGLTEKDKYPVFKKWAKM